MNPGPSRPEGVYGLRSGRRELRGRTFRPGVPRSSLGGSRSRRCPCIACPRSVLEHTVSEVVETRIVEDEVRAVGTADDEVPHPIARPDDIVAGAPRYPVVAQTTLHGVVVPATLDPVVAQPTEDVVVAVLAVEVVGSLFAAYEVAALPGEYGVVLVGAKYAVVVVGAKAVASTAMDRRRQGHPAAHDHRQRNRR